MDEQERMEKMMELLSDMVSHSGMVMNLSSLLVFHVSALQGLMDASEHENESLVAWNWSMTAAVSIGMNGAAAVKCGVHQYFMMRELLRCPAITSFSGQRHEELRKLKLPTMPPGELVGKVRNDNSACLKIADYLEEKWQDLQHEPEPCSLMEKATQRVVEMICEFEASGAVEEEKPGLEDWEPKFPWSDEEDDDEQG